ncbi:MAG TPA: hypothetical protein VNS34_05410 [Rhizobiaceae bacterium]|nr:hypothetical protein [Rhizobiaceae bacterium]
MQELIQADEIMLSSPGHSQGVIRRPVELIADALGMPDLEA